MPFSEVYRRQVQLLVAALPLVTQEDCFALKGGTAINLFHRNLPRLSVDIDLTYLPIAGRPESLSLLLSASQRPPGFVYHASKESGGFGLASLGQHRFSEDDRLFPLFVR